MSVLSVVTSPFSFLTLLILIFLPFFLDESGQWFVYFVYLFKESAFSFVDFCYSLFCFFFIYFCPNFMTFSFYKPQGSSFLLFLVALGIKLGYLFDFSLVSWDKLVLLWTFPLALILLNPIGFGLSCFHFHLFLWIFWFLLLFLLWFVGYSEACCLTSMWL